MAKVADEAAAKEAEKVLGGRPVGDQLAGGLGHFSNQVVRVNGMSAEDRVAIADSFQDLLPHLFAVLDLVTEAQITF